MVAVQTPAGYHEGTRRLGIMPYILGKDIRYVVPCCYEWVVAATFAMVSREYGRRMKILLTLDVSVMLKLARTFTSFIPASPYLERCALYRQPTRFRLAKLHSHTVDRLSCRHDPRVLILIDTDGSVLLRPKTSEPLETSTHLGPASDGIRKPKADS